MREDHLSKNRGRQILMIFGGSLILGLLYSGVLIAIAPGVYRSKAVIELNEEFLSKGNFEEVIGNGSADDLFSEVVLEEISNELELYWEWEMAPPEVIRMLEGMLEARSVGDQGKMEIECTSQYRKSAEEIVREYPKALTRVLFFQLESKVEDHSGILQRNEVEKRDLVWMSKRNVQEIVERIGEVQFQAEELTKERFLKFFNGLSENEQEQMLSLKDELLKALEVYEHQRKELEQAESALRGDQLAFSGIVPPVIVHESARPAEEVNSIELLDGLKMGLGRGAFLGAGLVVLAHLVFWRNTETETGTERRLSGPKPDSNDPW